MHRVAIIEDDPRYRAALGDLLTLSPGFTVGQSFRNGHTALRWFEERLQLGEPHALDLVVTDIDMPEVDGIATARALKRLVPDLPVVVLTVFENPGTILEAICAGADGYLLKKTSGAELLAQLEQVLAGGAPLTPSVARSILGVVRRHVPAQQTSRELIDLTEREHDVLRGLSRGRTYRQVAEELEVSIDTVRSHIRTLYRKLHVNSASAAVSRALKSGLL